MRRMFKAFISLALCCLLFALSACGQVQSETPENPETPDAAVAVPEAPETPVTPNEEETPDAPEADPALADLAASTGIPLNLLEQRIAFSRSVSFTLPEGVTLGDYDPMLHYCGGGGVPLLKDGEALGALELRYPAELNLKWDDSGNLESLISVDNHASFSEEFTALDTAQPGIYAAYSQDNAAAESGEDCFWYAFWGQEQGELVYALKVSADSMDREAFVALATSAVFAENAF